MVCVDLAGELLGSRIDVVNALGFKLVVRGRMDDRYAVVVVGSNLPRQGGLSGIVLTPSSCEKRDRN